MLVNIYGNSVYTSYVRDSKQEVYYWISHIYVLYEVPIDDHILTESNVEFNYHNTH